MTCLGRIKMVKAKPLLFRGESLGKNQKTFFRKLVKAVEEIKEKAGDLVCGSCCYYCGSSCVLHKSLLTGEDLYCNDFSVACSDHKFPEVFHYNPEEYLSIKKVLENTLTT